MIYLDHNATTPLCPEARGAMLPLLGDLLGNPSGIHASARVARAAVDESRDRIAALLGAKSHEIIFTSGGTESCNLGVLGLARRHRSPGKSHLVTASTEHHAVLHAMRALAEREGFELSEVSVDEQGVIDPEVFAAALRPETILASVMIANNETGVIQPIAELSALCRERGILFHTDAVQAFGKIPCKPGDLGVDALSATAHKFHGPHGAGFLWLRSGISIEAIQHGGFHENERRPGTENVPAIAGMAAAAEVAVNKVSAAEESSRETALRDRLWVGISEMDPTAVRNSASAPALSNTLNVSFPGCDGETLLMGLDLEGVAASSGSACMVGSIQASHVLLAMGVSEELARATVRFSLGRETTSESVDATLAALSRVLGRQSRFPQAAGMKA
jgi:cysteine desulfurase